MLVSLAGALLPVLLGVCVALLPRVERGMFGPVRTFAVAAALTVVLADLLPEALAGLGLWALLAFGGALLLPGVIERLGHHSSQRSALALELGFVGLLLHQAVDGFGIGVATQQGQGGAVTLAIAAHSAPLVAAATLGYVTNHGPRAALWRGVGLLLATALGVFVGTLATSGIPDTIEPWIQAALGGLLLHILGHDLREDPPRTVKKRFLELLALLIGFITPMVPLRPVPDAALALGNDFLSRNLPLAPVLFSGLLLRAMMPAGLVVRGLAPLHPDLILISACVIGVPSTFVWVLTEQLLHLLYFYFKIPVSHPIPDHPETALARLLDIGRKHGPWLLLGLSLGALIPSVHVTHLLLLPLAFLPPFTLLPLLGGLLANGLPPTWGLGMLLAELALRPLRLGEGPRRQRLQSLFLGGGVSTGMLWLFASQLSPPSELPISDELYLISLAALGLLLVASMAQEGPRAWFAPLSPEHHHG